MKHYEAPVLEVVLFEELDLLALSGEDTHLPLDPLGNMD